MTDERTAADRARQRLCDVAACIQDAHRCTNHPDDSVKRRGASMLNLICEGLDDVERAIREHEEEHGSVAMH